MGRSKSRTALTVASKPSTRLHARHREEIRRADRLARIRRQLRTIEAGLAGICNALPVGAETELAERVRAMAAILVEITVLLERDA